jgi:hypothetical protein
VPLFRRRRLPPELEPAYAAFELSARHVDLAQRAMLRCVPGSARSMALPLEVGAGTLRLALADARAAMPAWRHPAVAGAWAACAAAIEETLARVEPAVAAAAATAELEDALDAVSDLLEPLHAFVDAEAAFAALRR